MGAGGGRARTSHDNRRETARVGGCALSRALLGRCRRVHDGAHDADTGLMLDLPEDMPVEGADADVPAQRGNSVDATRGQPIISRVMARKHELEALLEGLPADHHNRVDIDLALGNVDRLITGDLDHLPAVVAAGLNQWLERSKHLGESTP
jgi:hypothetical protein